VKIQHSTVIELPRDVDAKALKRALDEVPDNALVSTDVYVIEPDRPGEVRRSEVSLHCVWEAEKS